MICTAATLQSIGSGAFFHEIHETCAYWPEPVEARNFSESHFLPRPLAQLGGILLHLHVVVLGHGGA